MQIAGNVQNMLDQGSSSYTPSISGLQQQAFNSASTLGGPSGSSQYFDSAGTALNGMPQAGAGDVTGASLLDNGLDQYYNPFKSQVLNPVLSDFDYQAGQTRAAQAAQAAAGQAFQGSRYGIQEANTEDNLARGRASTEGTLLNQMYGQATTLADQDAARRQQAALANQSTQLSSSEANQQAALQRAQQLASLGTTSGADTRANLGIQAGLGGVLTDAQNQIAQYPITYQQQMAGLLSGLDPSLYASKTVDTTGATTGNQSGTTSENPGLLGSLGQAAQIASLFAPSDGRLKVGIKALFKDWKGRRWVEFAYRWAPSVRHIGLIAQELMAVEPEAVAVGRDGYLRVNYGSLV
jgi:hypothetical protein